MAFPRIDREGPRRRPEGDPIGYQTWSHLTFLHWKLTPEQIRPLVPAPLELDLYDGHAWVGMVLFRMAKIRPWWSPPIPGISWFRETNIRTYVHFEGQPGVLFMSLDASKLLAALLGRYRWNLPYYWSRMRCQEAGDLMTYASCRQPGVRPKASCALDVRLGDPLTGLAEGTGVTHDSLEFFLVERYLLYTFDGGELLRGQVHHSPYPLRPAEVLSLNETMLAAVGVETQQGPCHAVYSPGVDVEIFPLLPVAQMAQAEQPQTVFAS